MAPEGEEEGRGENGRQQGPGGARGPAGGDPEGGEEGEEVAFGDGPPAAVEVERPGEQEAARRGERGEDQYPPPLAPAEGEQAQEERQVVGEDPDVPPGQEVEGIPGREAETEHVRRQPGAVAAT